MTLKHLSLQPRVVFSGCVAPQPAFETGHGAFAVTAPQASPSRIMETQLPLSEVILPGHDEG